MSENKYNSNAREDLAVPHSLDDLHGYFIMRNDQMRRLVEEGKAEENIYKGYASAAAYDVAAIEKVRASIESGELKIIDLQLIPGQHGGIYRNEQPEASVELQELIFGINRLTSIADETTDSDPYGRIIYQSLDPENQAFFIETRSQGSWGDMVRLTVSTDIPSELVKGNPYSPETIKAIKKSQALQRLASKAISGARDAELDYYQYVKQLPTAKYESPYDRAA